MSKENSYMSPLGTAMPDFSLPDFNGVSFNSSSLKGKPVLVIFLCNHCPFVVHLITPLAEQARKYEEQGVHVIGINSNDVSTHPEDSPENMKSFARERNISFPYLYDETQKTAQVFKAACTPDFFLYNGEHKLVYRGQFDGSRPSNDIPITGEDLNKAVDALVAGKAIQGAQKPSIGCSIKWKEENKPL